MRTLLIIFVLLFTNITYAEIAVVVNQDSPVDQLNKREVANIFLAKTTRLANGNKIKPIELSDNQSKKIFYETISNKTLPQVNSYWTTLIFTGKGKPPKNIKKIGQLIEELNNNPDAITYLPIEKITDAMKVVHRF